MHLNCHVATYYSWLTTLSLDSLHAIIYSYNYNVFFFITVGFLSDEYCVDEGDTVEITVGLLSGKLRDVIGLSLDFSTASLNGEYHTFLYMHVPIYSSYTWQ